MSAVTKFYLKNRERLSRMAKGQTMTEYALILAAVAIVVFIGGSQAVSPLPI